ncbi:MAG: glycosyltransferase [Syntrophomonadaceae bacterium]|nr:glycosyltransferase [Syntrophomonadaceae bacterium]
MKVLFVHDATFKYDKDGKYYGTSVNPKTLSRYKYLSDDITVLIRTEPFKLGENKEKYTKITDDFKVVHIPNYNSIKGRLIDIKNVKKTVTKLVNEADIVFARFSGPTGKIAARECAKMGKPYVVECVGCSWDSLWNHSIKGKLIAFYSYLNTRNLIKNAPYIVYVTNEFLQKRYPTKGKWISASNVEIDDMNNIYIDQRIERIRNKSKNEPIILGTAAAIDVPYKGHAYVIKAIARLNKKGYNYKYQVIGTGNKKRLLKIAKKYKIEDKIEFLGVLRQDKVFEWIEDLDIYIQPSLTEGLPRALIEAMSRGCPCIASNAGGIPELIEDEYIFKKGNVKDLIRILLSFDKEKLQSQAIRNFKYSFNYKKEFLDQRRREFYMKVAEETKLIK